MVVPSPAAAGQKAPRDDRRGEQEFTQGFQQSLKFVGAAARALGIEL